jgi:hypothetical protein
MLRAMLNQNAELLIVRETHYFDDLRPRLGEGARHPLGNEDRERCERYFQRLGEGPYGQSPGSAPSVIQLEALRRDADRLGGSGDAYFEAFCKGRAATEGKVRWGEKTPRHIFRIPDLMSVFPDARVICLVRDPRAVAASYRNWKRNEPSEQELATSAADRRRIQRSYNAVLHALLWRSSMAAAVRAHDTYGDASVRLQPYEQLVSEPDDSLRGLAEWLGLEYDPAMLDIPIVHSSYGLKGEGTSTAPIDRWQQKLPAAEIAVIQRCCGGFMAAFGYELVETNVRTMSLVRTWLSGPAAFLRAVTANHNRIAHLPDYLARRIGLSSSRAA